MLGKSQSQMTALGRVPRSTCDGGRLRRLRGQGVNSRCFMKLGGRSQPLGPGGLASGYRLITVAPGPSHPMLFIFVEHPAQLAIARLVGYVYSGMWLWGPEQIYADRAVEAQIPQKGAVLLASLWALCLSITGRKLQLWWPWSSLSAWMQVHILFLPRLLALSNFSRDPLNNIFEPTVWTRLEPGVCMSLFSSVS